jgi:hypothetical protein
MRDRVVPVGGPGFDTADDNWVNAFINGRCISADIRGTGKPPIIVTLAGLGEQSPSVRKVSELLANEATLIKLGRFGIEMSDGRIDPFEPIDVATIANESNQAIKMICDYYGFPTNDLTLLTHSFGGIIGPSLIENAQQHKLRYTRWQDNEGSAPELLFMREEAALLLFDGSLPAFLVGCASGQKNFPIYQTGVSVWPRNIAMMSALNLVKSSRQVRGAKLPPDLQYHAFVRGENFHLNHPIILLTKEEERYWQNQNFAKARSLRGPIFRYRSDGHDFLHNNPHAMVAALRIAFAHGTKNLLNADFSAIQAAGADPVRIEELRSLPPLEDYTSFHEVPKHPLVENSGPFLDAFLKTDNRRGAFGMALAIANATGPNKIADQINEYISRRPKLASDPATYWVPDPVFMEPCMERIDRCIHAARNGYFVEKNPPSSGQPQKSTPITLDSGMNRVFRTSGFYEPRVKL